MSVKIMTWVWDNSLTKGSKRLVLLALADNSNDSGICWPSIATLAKKTKLSRRYTINILNELEEEGAIERENRKRDGMFTSNLYKVVVNPASLPSEPRITTPSEAQDTTGSEPQLTRVVSSTSLKPSVNHKIEPPLTSDGHISTLYEQEIGLLTPMIAEQIKDWVDNHPQDWIEDAIKIAAENNTRKVSYVNGILKNWRIKGRNNLKKKSTQKMPGVFIGSDNE